MGTRLKSVISDVPKPMAPIGEKPFLHYIFKYLKSQNVKKVVLCVSYKKEVIQEYFLDNYLGISIQYSIENEPLGTGGAVFQALSMLSGKMAYILNGDTFFDIDLARLKLRKESKITLALKSMKDFDRYGCVELDKDFKIQAFREKEYKKIGFINGGIYLIDRAIFEGYDLASKFSFEEFIQEHFIALNAYGEKFDDYFIDIGIPEDYNIFCDYVLKQNLV